MKIKLIGLAILTSITSVAMISTPPPCGTDAFLEHFAPKLGEYIFIKTFDIKTDPENNKSSASYILSKGSKYKIIICDQDEKGNKMKVKLYDRNHKLISSNYNSDSKKYYTAINYTCNATGVYHIESSFRKGKHGCGNIILGFSK